MTVTPRLTITIRFSILKCLGAKVFKLLLVFFLYRIIFKWVPLKVIVLIFKFFSLQFVLTHGIYEPLERCFLDDQLVIPFKLTKFFIRALFFLWLRFFLVLFIVRLFFWRCILFGGVWNQVFICENAINVLIMFYSLNSQNNFRRLFKIDFIIGLWGYWSNACRVWINLWSRTNLTLLVLLKLSLVDSIHFFCVPDDLLFFVILTIGDYSRLIWLSILLRWLLLIGFSLFRNGILLHSW